MTPEPIETSLALAGELAGDLTPLVYNRLFARHPQTKALFWRDTNGKIRGEMLARVFEAILDFAGERNYADNMIRCEIVTHAEFDVPPEIFRNFFAVVADTVRAALGNQWTAPMDEAWRNLLAELDGYVLGAAAKETAP